MPNNDQNPFTIAPAAAPRGDLSGKYKKKWIEESLDIESAERNRLAVAHTTRYLGTSISARAVNVFLVIMALGFLLIFGRVFYLQIIKGDYYRSLAEGNRIRLTPIPAERGIIYDRFNRELTRNVPSFSLAIIPQDLPRDPAERGKIIDQVAEISGRSAEDIKALLSKYSAYSFESITLRESLDYTTALTLYVRNADLPGVAIESGSQRSYISAVNTSTVSLSHVLGYLSKLNDQELRYWHSQGYLTSDDMGKVGVEKMYESYLRGHYGRKKIEVNAAGKEQTILAVDPPTPGQNLNLTIDLEAQKKMESLVAATAERTKKHRIAAVALNPNNGEILALVSWPAFDNNKFSGGIDQASYDSYLNDADRPLFNRAIAGSYPPGSTVKLIISAAALQEKIITKTTSFNSVGGIVVGGQLFKDWKAGGHGATNVLKALAWSVNTFFYYAGGGYERFVGLGVDTIRRYLEAFGLSHQTGVDLPGENDGFLPSKEWKQRTKGETWYVGDTYNISIGQGDILVTPLQVAVWTAAVANGGAIITPHVGKFVTDPVTKKTTALLFSKRSNGLVSGQNLAIVREGMRDCVTFGSCQPIKTLPFAAAGKTGTAQWSKTHPTHAWFTSFAPYSDPQIVVTVLVEDGGEGSVVALPIANGFLEWWGKKYLLP
ncbi:MAG: penicillin-binding protein 2 [Candidatus Magasanikbacteria bacterium]|nr:penicillin-binding protein 2 [Candidatus Magasanikbacteria bacterium]